MGTYPKEFTEVIRTVVVVWKTKNGFKNRDFQIVNPGAMNKLLGTAEKTPKLDDTQILREARKIAVGGRLYAVYEIGDGETAESLDAMAQRGEYGRMFEAVRVIYGTSEFMNEYNAALRATGR